MSQLLHNSCNLKIEKLFESVRNLIAHSQGVAIHVFDFDGNNFLLLHWSALVHLLYLEADSAILPDLILFGYIVGTSGNGAFMPNICSKNLTLKSDLSVQKLFWTSDTSSLVKKPTISGNLLTSQKWWGCTSKRSSQTTRQYFGMRIQIFGETHLHSLSGKTKAPIRVASEDNLLQRTPTVEKAIHQGLDKTRGFARHTFLFFDYVISKEGPLCRQGRCALTFHLRLLIAKTVDELLSETLHFDRGHNYFLQRYQHLPDFSAYTLIYAVF